MAVEVNVGAVSVRAEGAHVLRRLSSTSTPPSWASSNAALLSLFHSQSYPSSLPSVLDPKRFQPRPS
jgi:hypothetical protein